jgi:hypothetical protein
VWRFSWGLLYQTIGNVTGTRGPAAIFVLAFSQVELGGLEPPTPCLQSDVYGRCDGPDLARQLSVSSREIPQRTPANGTLAR